MLAYHKSTTRHPYCIYLTGEEARELAIEAAIAADASDDVPLMTELEKKLRAVIGKPSGTRA